MGFAKWDPPPRRPAAPPPRRPRECRHRLALLWRLAPWPFVVAAFRVSFRALSVHVHQHLVLLWLSRVTLRPLSGRARAALPAGRGADATQRGVAAGPRARSHTSQTGQTGQTGAEPHPRGGARAGQVARAAAERARLDAQRAALDAEAAALRRQAGEVEEVPRLIIIYL